MFKYFDPLFYQKFLKNKTVKNKMTDRKTRKNNVF